MKKPGKWLPKNLSPRVAPNGLVYLNLGCGKVYSPEWNNLDHRWSVDIIRHDLRKPLPFGDGIFNAVYSSHALEHLGPAEGCRLMQEIHRVCKPGGICRMVVPDLELSCRLYLEWLEKASRQPAPESLWRY